MLRWFVAYLNHFRDEWLIEALTLCGNDRRRPAGSLFQK